jgi:Fe-S-cluster containining protein
MNPIVNPIAQTDFNQKLATACQAKGAACCCRGQIFLPENQYQALRQWVAGQSPADLPELEARTQTFDEFRLYDQKDRCQFLDQQGRCRLHSEGVKPTECFWWPFHVFTAPDDHLEIRLSNVCCDAYKHFSPGLPFLDLIEAQARQIGYARLRAFRAIYPGNDQLMVVKKLADAKGA